MACRRAYCPFIYIQPEHFELLPWKAIGDFMIKTPQLVKKCICICIWSINLCKSIGNQIKFEKPPDPNLMKTTKTKWKPTKNGQCLDETLSSIEVAPSLFEQFLPTVNTQYVIGVLERHPKCLVGQLRTSFFSWLYRFCRKKFQLGWFLVWCSHCFSLAKNLDFV